MRRFLWPLGFALAGCSSPEFPRTTAVTPEASGVFLPWSSFEARTQRQRLRYVARLQRADGRVLSFTLLLVIGYPESPFRAIGVDELSAPLFEASISDGEVRVGGVGEVLDATFLERHLLRDLYGLFRPLAASDLERVLVEGARPGVLVPGFEEDLLHEGGDPKLVKLWFGRSDVRSTGGHLPGDWPFSKIQITGKDEVYQLVLEALL